MARKSIVTVQNAEGGAWMPIPLYIEAPWAKSIIISGMPSGSKLSNGNLLTDGNWTVPPESLPALTFLPPPGFGGQIEMKVNASTEEHSAESTFLITVVSSAEQAAHKASEFVPATGSQKRNLFYLLMGISALLLAGC